MRLCGAGGFGAMVCWHAGGFSGMALLGDPIGQISYDAAARMLYEGGGT
jgi:hypothetical protein